VRERVEAELAGLGGVVRVTVEGTVAAEVDVHPGELEGVGSHLDAVVLRMGQVNWDYNIDHIATLDTVQGEFVREVLGAGFDSDQERKVLITGLRALEGRKDLAVL